MFDYRNPVERAVVLWFIGCAAVWLIVVGIATHFIAKYW